MTFCHHATIFVRGASTSQSITTGGTFEKLTAFTTDGISNAMTAAAASDKITATTAGVYMVCFQVSFSGTVSSTVQFVVKWNGVEQDQIKCTRKLGTGGDVGSASMMGLVDVTSVPTDIEVWFTTDGDGDSITVEDAQLAAHWLSTT